MGSADVATAKAKTTLIINLIIASSDNGPAPPPDMGSTGLKP